MANRSHNLAVILAALSTLLAVGCSSADPGSQSAGGAASTVATPIIPERYALQQALDFTITLTTTSVGGTFGRIDRTHTCERRDTSPHLAWEGVPDGAESLVLVMEDPASDVLGFSADVLWTHWVVYSIPPDVTELEPGQVTGELLENGATQGSNDYERVQYNGPCPIPTIKFPVDQCSNPTGAPGGGGRSQQVANLTAEERPYYFKLFALDIPVDLPSGTDRDALMEAIDGHILASGELPVPYKSIKSYSCKSQDALVCMDSVRR